MVVGVRVGDGRRVQHGEVVGRPGTRAVRTALDGDGSLPLPRLGVRKVRARGSAIVALATAGAASGFMKSSWGMLVLLLVYGLAMSVASTTVKWSGVRALVRYAPPLTEMARRFRAIVCGSGECTRVRLRRLPLSRHTGCA